MKSTEAGDPLAPSNPEAGQEESDSPKYVTAEQNHAAITARLREFEKRQDKRFEEFLSKLSTQSQPSPAKQSNDSGSEEFKALKAKLDAALSEVGQIRQEKQLAEAKAKDVDLRSKLTEELGRVGVSAKSMKVAVGYLVDAEKLVQFDEDGQIVMRVEGSNLPTDLRSGLKSWAKTEEAKMFLTPKNAAGSGNSPDFSQSRKGGDEEEKQDFSNAALYTALFGSAPAGTRKLNPNS